MRHSSLLQAMSVVVDFADFTDVQLLAKGCCGIVMRAKVGSLLPYCSWRELLCTVVLDMVV
jgi:hypothetical protein